MSSVKVTSQVDNIPYLPDDLWLNCLARVSRLYYPTLSLVSKRFHSLIASIELYQTRRLLGRTESCLYVCISFSGSNQRWFTLCRRPTPTPNPNPKPRWFTACFRPCRILKNRTRKEDKEDKKPSDNLMVSVPTRNFSTPPSRCARAVIGSNIYTIDECIDDDGFSSRVFFMDCRSHTWHEAPSMRIPQERSLASVLDGKIYVVDELEDLDSSNLIESFDPKTQKWEHVPGPSAEIARDSVSRILAMDGKLYLCGIDITVAYKPKENKWDVVELDMRLDLVDPESSCVVDNVTYSYMLAILKWYDSKGRLWRDLKGLEELPILPYTRVRLVNYGGKIAVFWGKKVRSAIGSDNKMIWCAVIAVERRSNEHEVYGKIEWCDVVLTVPKSCRLLEFLAVNV